MMNEIHISGLTVTLIGSFIGVLLAIIAFLIVRFIDKFETSLNGLATNVSTLNETMVRIDADLKGKVALIEQKHDALFQEVSELDALWDRVRNAENDITQLKAGGCDIARRCVS